MKITDHSNIKKIGIIGWGLMGDVLMRTPVLHAIRDIFPEARIIVSVDPIGEEVLRNNPDIDQILVINRNKRPKWNYLLNKLKAWDDIRSQKFDLVIDLYNGKSSNNMMRLSGAKYQVTFRDGDEKPKIGSFHITNELLCILSVFHGSYKNYSTKPIFFIRSSTNDKMKMLMSEWKIQKPYLLNFGSGGPEKILPMEKSFEQVKLLYSTYGYIPIVICNPGQEYLQKTFLESYLVSSGIPYRALPVLSLEEIGSLMRLNNFIITPDTGLYHIAVAIGIPILGIFTYTDPRLVEPESGLYWHCFQSDIEFDNTTLRFGKRDLDLDYLLESTRNFIEIIS